LIVETLNMAGYELIEAGNPLEVLENPPALPVDLVLTDVVMPKMSGPEFAQLWHRQHPGTPFLFISGYFDESRFPPGFNRKDLLLKPFRANELLGRIAERLGRKPAEMAS
ncbi:MAG TPA: response regulator, partial [Candidatus Acidoferrum sp.]|nr:response regulator [Candidatus Acidoferrum sp.]